MPKRQRSDRYPLGNEPPPVVDPALAGKSEPVPYASLTLSERGAIVAANEQAALLLGRPLEEMAGLEFGELAAEQRSSELELLAWRHGKLEPVAVEVERQPSQWGDSYVALALKPLAERRAPTLALSEALGLAIADANQFLPRQAFELRLTRLPRVRVAASLRHVLGGWVAFLAEAAGDFRADLSIEATEMVTGERDSVRLWLRLARRGRRGSRPGEPPAKRPRRKAEAVGALEERARRLAAASGAEVWSPGRRALTVCLNLPLAEGEALAWEEPGDGQPV